MIGQLEEAILRKPHRTDLRDFQKSVEYYNGASDEHTQENASLRLDYRRIEHLLTTKEIASATSQEDSSSENLTRAASSLTGPRRPYTAIPYLRSRTQAKGF